MRLLLIYIAETLLNTIIGQCHLVHDRIQEECTYTKLEFHILIFSIHICEFYFRFFLFSIISFLSDGGGDNSNKITEMVFYVYFVYSM